VIPSYADIVIRPDRDAASGDRGSRRASAGITRTSPETDVHRPVGQRPATNQITTEPTAMTTQIDIFGSDQDWTVPALLVVLMTILAMLGIVANVAAA